jgi:hypothetical protein
MPMQVRFASSKAIICTGQILFLTALAQAQTIASVLQDFGLFGTWAVACEQRPSPTNEFAIFSVNASGGIRLWNDFGPDYDDMIYRIVDARRVGPDKLLLRQVLTTDRRIVLDIVMVKDNDRIRVWSSRMADGKILVNDGALASSNGHETRWVVRCQGQWADDRDPDEGSARRGRFIRIDGRFPAERMP